jgi:hypothetical protein
MRLTSRLLLTLAVLSLPASAWNIPGHMLSAAIAYQILQQENPQTIEKVKALLRETSLVRQPMAGEAARCPRCRA